MNSVANLILHLAGNLRQWWLAGVGGAPDERDRPGEFSERGPVHRTELLQTLDQTVAESAQMLAGPSPPDLTSLRRIQGFEVTGMQAIVASLAHFKGHTQEIVHLARYQLADDYRFDFVPTSPEQGAP